jgi:hypothetical protein
MPGCILQMQHPTVIIGDRRLFAVEAQQMIEVTHVMQGIRFTSRFDIPVHSKDHDTFINHFSQIRLPDPSWARSARKARVKSCLLVIRYQSNKKQSEVYYLMERCSICEQTG